MVYNIGQMVRTMKDTGHTIKLKVKELFGMQKVTYIEASSGMIWPMVMENTRTLMGQNIRENLRMTFRKATVKKSGSMEPSTWAPTNKE